MTAEIIPLNEIKIERKCSFCKKPESQVKHLIGSSVTSHCLCGECVKLAREKTQEDKA